MNSQDVILGMLMKRSLTGYEIKQLLENLFSHFYSSSYGTIYPMLSRMEKEKLITKENIVQEGKPNKNVYTITDIGKGQFNSYLQSPMESESVKSDFLMRLYFGQFVGYGKVIEWLLDAQQDAQKQLDEINKKYSLYKDQMQPTQIICIRMGIKAYSSKLEVIEEGLASIRQLEQGERN
ncbi:PadR family transcriptional regulator [Cohnella silvisoli]|uniref:PadR family transcriptional regulator n=1 Tax=Cohnella silvisoli TaxID=2873699 RepID=A0ABV1L0W9_9BACL|nr:PadR family transcriptional regulator [Cohnella silvisoli]MCD9025363.1 PadR family transcriptional regulator [Cohnella silvisoli]